MFLSKRLAELERENNDVERQNFTLQNKLNQSLSEKEQMRQQINVLKNQLRIANEMNSDISLRAHINNQYGIG
jgi:chromosome segregation ATPase